jgi:hypothetical protein
MDRAILLLKIKSYFLESKKKAKKEGKTTGIYILITRGARGYSKR